MSTALEAVTYAVLVAVGVIQSFEDIDTRRVHVLTSQVVGVGTFLTLSLVALISGEPNGIIRMVLCAIAMWVLFFALDRATQGGIGKGDVRLAPVIGSVTGYLSVESFVLGLLVIAVGGFALALIALIRFGSSARIPFVPVMYVAVVVSVIAQG